MALIVDADVFLSDIALITGKSISTLSKSVSVRIFRSFFGISPETCVQVLYIIRNIVPCTFKTAHLLSGCMFLKVYSTEFVHSGLAKVDPKTFRQWAWIAINALSSLKLVCERKHRLLMYTD